MLRASLAVVGGLLALQHISLPVGYDLIAAALVALLIGLPWIRRRDLVLASLAALWFATHVNAAADDRLDRGLEADSLLVTARVLGFPRTQRGSTSFVAALDGDSRLPARVRLSWRDPPVAVTTGDIWRLQVRLRRPRGSANPGTPDYEAWLTRERFGATGYVVAGSLNQLFDSGRHHGLQRLRVRYVERVRDAIGDGPGAAVLIALVVGSRHQLSPQQWQRYAATGTTHLMAISGLHVGLAALSAYAIVTLFLGTFGASGNLHRRALLAACVVACAYAAVSGFALPAQRAALMLVIATVGLAAMRQLDGMRLLACAALVIVVADPLATMAPGFALSFGAVFWLLWLARRVSAAASRVRDRPFVAGKRLLEVQLVLSFGLLSLTVLLFGRCSLAAPLINAVAVPLFSVVTVPLALASLVLDGPLQSVGDVALRGAALSVDGLERLIAAVADSHWSSKPVAGVGGVGWLWLLLPLARAALPPRWPGRSVAWLACAALLAWRPAGPPRACVDIEVLDVGQGLATVVRTASRVLVYDTGPSYHSGATAASRVVLPFLAHRGIGSIDTLMLSHGDLDHAGGARELLLERRIAAIYSGETVDGIASAPCVAGQAWRWDGVQFTVLHPPPDTPFTGNNGSCVLQIAVGERRVLLTGDIEAVVEARLVRARKLQSVDVVTVPHHGSRTSSSLPFVAALKPRLAIVSAAFGNQWGFPKADIVARWRARGADVLTTATSGQIGVRLCATGGIVSVVEYRRVRRHLWHDRDSRGY